MVVYADPAERSDIDEHLGSTEKNHRRARRELARAMARDLANDNPYRIWYSLKMLHRSKKPFRLKFANEKLPAPDDRTMSELALLLHGHYEDKWLAHQLVLQMQANQNEANRN